MIGVALLTVCCALAQAQTAARDARPPAGGGGTATIAGTVVSDEAQPRPLRRARVTINGTGLAPGRTAITGDNGAFVFDRLPAGRYTLAAAKDAYVAMNYGARRPLQAGTGILLGAGETQRVTVQLPRGAVITGVITDADGQPAQGVGVAALSRRFIGAVGDRRLLPSGVTTAQTDDRGVYRIFGLPAGDYIVSAQSQQRLVGLPVPEVRTVSQGAVGARGLTAAPVFYPGATDVARASQVTVAAGEERNGIDLQIQYVALATVAGIFPVTPGSTPPSITMARLGEIAGPEPIKSARPDADGRFSFTGVPPGQYMLIARSVPVPPAGPVQFATAEIVVDGDDMTNVGLSMQPAITIAGRLAFEGARPAPDVSGVRLPVMMAGQAIGNMNIGLPQIQLESGGRFAVAGIVPGAYRIGSLQGLPVQGIRAPLGGWWLKSVVVNGRDILDAPLDIRQGTDEAVATFTDQASELSGTVKDGQGKPASSDTFVVVFSTDRSTWFFNSRRIAGVRLDAEGRYSIRNLPPGEYRVIATTDLAQGEWFDPAALERLLPSAAAITVTGVEKKVWDIVIRP
jgi:hypothetical protein